MVFVFICTCIFIRVVRFQSQSQRFSSSSLFCGVLRKRGGYNESKTEKNLEKGEKRVRRRGQPDPRCSANGGFTNEGALLRCLTCIWIHGFFAISETQDGGYDFKFKVWATPQNKMELYIQGVASTGTDDYLTEEDTPLGSFKPFLHLYSIFYTFSSSMNWGSKRPRSWTVLADTRVTKSRNQLRPTDLSLKTLRISGNPSTGNAHLHPCSTRNPPPISSQSQELFRMENFPLA